MNKGFWNQVSGFQSISVKPAHATGYSGRSARLPGAAPSDQLGRQQHRKLAKSTVLPYRPSPLSER
jgi:hypothetical protein